MGGAIESTGNICREDPAVSRFLAGRVLAQVYGDSGSALQQDTLELSAPVRESRCIPPPFKAQSSVAGAPRFRTVTRSILESGAALRETARDARAGKPGAAERLLRTWGYTLENLPREGSLFIDPYFMEKELPGGQVTAARFPARRDVDTSVPPLEKILFGKSGVFTVTDRQGLPKTFAALDEYREYVAAERSGVLGLAGDPGEPKQVHLVLKGGGGKIKRQIAALDELYRMGIVPSFVTGGSSGAVLAALLATGAGPREIRAALKDPVLTEWKDEKGLGGMVKGQRLYDYVDRTLRTLTGIHDRPVTFADLSLPVNITACIYGDTHPAAGHEDMGKPENRLFVFSRETTPDTPVALAVRASCCIPGVFSPVEMTDPLTGRVVELVDGATVDNIPIQLGPKSLPTLALGLAVKGGLHPNFVYNNPPPLPFPASMVFAASAATNSLMCLGLNMHDKVRRREAEIIYNPPESTFVLTLPTYDLEKPSLGDRVLDFAEDPALDGKMDGQSVEVTDRFLREHLPRIGAPGARGTNLKPLPDRPWEARRFSRVIDCDGVRTQATSPGYTWVTFKGDDGSWKIHPTNPGILEELLLEDLAFGTLDANLREMRRDSPFNVKKLIPR